MGIKDKKILVVDDEQDIRIELSEYLERKGFLVIPASDGREAMEFFMAETIDAVVTDVKMPRTDGFELIRMIREQNNEIPIVALTGHFTIADLDRINAVGASETMKKPIKLRDLLSILEALLAAKEVQK